MMMVSIFFGFALAAINNGASRLVQKFSDYHQQWIAQSIRFMILAICLFGFISYNPQEAAYFVAGYFSVHFILLSRDLWEIYGRTAK